MEFTPAEAKEKEMTRQWVRTRDNTFLVEYGIPAGMAGRVIDAHRIERSRGALPEGVWVVNICFDPGCALVENIGKEQYEASFLECGICGR